MARLRHLIVLVPGIGGSILAAEGGAPRWGGSLVDIGKSVIWPQRIALDSSSPLVPVALLPTLGAVGSLHALCGYDAAVLAIRRAFPDASVATARPGAGLKSANVLLYPYDFRRSVVEAAEGLARAVDAAFEGTDSADRSNRVVVLAHSMGGLVARYWIGALRGWRECAHLITFGTPYRGAPKALDWLVNGGRVGRTRLDAATREFRGWPSLYELLPQYESVWDEDAGTAVELTELPESLTRRSPALMAYAPTFAAMGAAARAVHEDILASWRSQPESSLPTLTTYFSRGHPTANLITLAEGRLHVEASDPAWRGNAGWLGDGTVPALCAIPSDLNDNQEHWRYANTRHGDFAAMGSATDQLLSLSGHRPPTRGTHDGNESLGLDLEDIHSNRETFRFAACVSGSDDRPPSIVEQVSYTIWEGGRTRRVGGGSLERGGGSAWLAEGEPLPEGRYLLTVKAERAGKATLSTETHVIVVDPTEV